LGLDTSLHGQIPEYNSPGYYWIEYQVTSIVGAALRWFFLNSNINDKFKSTLEKTYFLHQNYPNPFNSKTDIQFKISKRNRVVLKIYNVLGREVCELTDKIYQPGIHQINWDASDFSSGIYFYHFKAGEFKSVKKMVLLR